MNKITKITTSLLLTVIIAIAGVVFVHTRSSSAASASDWIAGYIVDDYVFTNVNSMSVQDIQNFLNAKIGSCDTWGTGIATEFGYNGTRAQYAAANGWPAPPYTCLNMYYEVPKTAPSSEVPASNYSNPSNIPNGAQSAAWIIKDAAARYNISPQVLLVKLGTESKGPLTNDRWPLYSQYRYAMGAHCPDSGANGGANCDSTYAGFSIQIYEAAKLLRQYLDNMSQPWWGCVENSIKVQCPNNRENGGDPGGGYKVPSATNYILWTVRSRGCGGQNIYIQNKATAALYTYTPYQPNQAALNNLYGTGDNCSAYGNRNFWRVFMDWFGGTRVYYRPLDTPRYFELTAAVTKINNVSGEPVGVTLEAGTQIKFSSKIPIQGGWCFRSEWNTHIDPQPFCIPQSSLKEVVLTYEDIPESEQVKQLSRNSHKDSIIEGKQVMSLNEGRQLVFKKKTVIAGIDYYVTEWDSTHYEQPPYGVRLSELISSPKFESGNWLFKTSSDAPRLNLGTMAQVDLIPQNTLRTFTSRTKILDKWYYRTEFNGQESTAFGISEDNLVTPYAWVPFESPRDMRLIKDVNRIDPVTGVVIDRLQGGRVIHFSTKIFINGQWYFRTTWNTDHNENAAIPASSISEVY